MITLSVGEFKARFSEVIEWLKKGKEVEVTYGKKKEVIGVFKSPKHLKNLERRKLGIVRNSIVLSDDFDELTEDEFPIHTTI